MSSISPMLRNESTVEQNSQRIMSIPVRIDVILGSTKLRVSELMAIEEGTTIPLGRKVNEPVDLTVNGRIFARGEIVVLEGDANQLGIRLLEVS